VKKKLQTLVLAAVAAAFVVAPAREAQAISLAGRLAAIGREDVITTINDAFASAIARATAAGPPASTIGVAKLTLAQQLFNAIINFDPDEPTETPPT
jgi:hypothetical protein